MKQQLRLVPQLLKMRTLVAAMMCTLMGLSFAACSDDDDDAPATDIVGVWECVSGTNVDKDSYEFENGESINLMKDGRCLLPWDAVSDPKDEWSSWTLKGDKLTLMECDLDRWVGTIVVKGDEMTFTYKYQNWNYDSGTMTEESADTYVSVFKRK